MREVHLGWNSDTIERSEFKFVVEICDYFEVIAHLEITPKGVRQLVRVKFQADKNPNDLENIPFLEVEGPLTPHPLPDDGEEGIMVIWNRHPISIAAIGFEGLHIIPPYTIDQQGLNVTIRGLAEKISGFLKTVRILFPPDSVKVEVIKPVLHNGSKHVRSITSASIIFISESDGKFCCSVHKINVG